MTINEPVLVRLLAVKVSPAAGQTQDNSSPEKRRDLRIPGTLGNGQVSVYLLAVPDAV
jgi:hypothetical protein